MGIIILAVIKYIISFLCCMLFTYIISENKYTRLWWILISILIYSMSYITLNKYLPIEFLGDFLTLITISLMYKDTRSKKNKKLCKCLCNVADYSDNSYNYGSFKYK